MYYHRRNLVAMRSSYLSILILLVLAVVNIVAQPETSRGRQVRTVTVPVTIFTKKEIKDRETQELIQVERFQVFENNEEQQFLSIRSVSDTPISLAIVIQDNLLTEFNLQLADIKQFIRGLPRGSRVLVAYGRSGSTQIVQRFTEDLEKAANSLRIVSGNSTLAPRSPFDSISEIAGRFDGVPAGRRAIVFFSDGLDASQGFNLASISQSFELEQAAIAAQRRSIPVYSIYSPTTSSANADSIFILASQGALEKLSTETGGKAYFRGTFPPLNFLSFFQDISNTLNRQFALTYLSTNMKKGYYRLKITNTNPEIVIAHPKGYRYR
jgi:VWFA-related protein